MVLARKRTIKLLQSIQKDEIRLIFGFVGKHFRRKYAGAHKFAFKINIYWTLHLATWNAWWTKWIQTESTYSKHSRYAMKYLWNLAFEAKFIEIISIKKYNEHATILPSFYSVSLSL